MRAFHPGRLRAAVLIVLLQCAAGSACAGGAATSAAAPAAAPISTPAAMLALAVGTDKALYAPGSKVHIRVGLSNPGASAVSGTRLTVAVRHLGQDAGTLAADAAIPAGGSSSVELAWTAPATDFQGYSIEAVLVDGAGRTLASESGAIDVSSSWLKFPRYGYVSQYGAGVDAHAVIGQLSAYHINALQFYDWQWKHHLPLKGAPGALPASWPDIANRTVQRETVNALISAAHGAGMAAMEYNLIYGAAINYTHDGVSPAWGLYDTAGGKQWQFALPPRWATSALYFFNPADVRWQNYLFARELDVFRAFPFDGWHADTVGDNGIKYDALGHPVDIKDTFKPFLNAAKAALGSKLLVMNAVGNKGHQQVNSSKVDAVYVEVWPDDGFPDYRSLKDVVDQARAESGGKSLIVPAYMNYDYAKTKSAGAPGQFNDPGVLLTEATVLAAGGSRLELGDDDRMLCNEYFPNRALAMSASLKTAMRRYYDFSVAYENLLRDGQVAAPGPVLVDGVAAGASGAAGTVWAFAKADPRYETVNLINLKGLTDVSWRDTGAAQKKPIALGSFRLRYYTVASLDQAWVASPDRDGGRSARLPLAHGSDANGAYVEVTVPALAYWNLVYFRKTP